MKQAILITSLYLSGVVFLGACQPKAEQEVNDSNTPLHLLQPAYQNPYGIPSESSIKQVLDRVWTYLDKETPTQVVDAVSGEEIADYTKIDRNSVLKSGAFRLTSYEWGVTYAGMTLIGEVTGDKKYSDYTTRRLQYLSEIAPHFRKLLDDKSIQNPQLHQLLTPKALDDCGSMCAAFIKASYQENAPDYRSIIDNYMDWIMNGQMRLADGTLARNRPQLNTLWLDDMFMSIPAMAWMGKFTGEARYYDEAVRQIRQFASRMFIPEKNLFMHGWVEGTDHPAFLWGRANGWAVMTLVEVLEVLPETHEGYADVMALLKNHIRGLVALQSGEGLWHQLLDKSDSYLETSASAIYIYAIARAINNGWIDARIYGPSVVLAWNAVSQQVNAAGQVMGTCVGTGMAFDPAFYYYRPVNVFAAHGYGPVLLAGGEMMVLLKKTHPKMNDNAVQFYDKEVITDQATFEIEP
ncbi:glycoside hydrolase family 88 protein [Parabacteroides sp. PF5-6]|uniref:glycoside hydrolase family 88/105 protein n=1 Tax=Parabacteroides sp. PF5-6 TaxID=1742403 RepID=UPI0024074523|nr:glycoside hydrolase family 88 protein [Parabacteroides sp. PF5-6]MDF9828730.1 rhamnogalacturonyl hydrolase YesR [Parabacteroides sp. PF5-6]